MRKILISAVALALFAATAHAKVSLTKASQSSVRSAMDSRTFSYGKLKFYASRNETREAASDVLKRAVQPLFSDQLAGPDDAGGERRLPWSGLMRRAYALDVLVCPKCSGPMQVIAFINDERVARRILAHLGLPTATPTFKPARDPPQTQFAWDVSRRCRR